MAGFEREKHGTPGAVGVEIKFTIMRLVCALLASHGSGQKFVLQGEGDGEQQPDDPRGPKLGSPSSKTGSGAKSLSPTKRNG